MEGGDRVRKRLAQDILPALVMGRSMSRLGYFRFQRCWLYLTALWAALVSAGIVNAGLEEPPEVNAPPAQAALIGSAALESLPNRGETSLLTLAGIVTGALIKVYRDQYGTQRRFEFARVSMRRLHKIETLLARALPAADPNAQLDVLKQNIEAIVDGAIDADAWPWRGVPDEFLPAIEAEADRLTQRFGPNWTAVRVAAVDRREHVDL